MIASSTFIQASRARRFPSASKPSVIVDFADAKNLRLHGNQSEFSEVPLDRERGMQIKTEANAAYPSVQIETGRRQMGLLSGF